MIEYTPLTDLQWDELKPLFKTPAKRGRGKPHSSWRAVLNAILFVLLCNSKWGAWPKTSDFSSKSAAHRWYLEWEKEGKLEEILYTVEKIKPDATFSHPPRRVHNPHPNPIKEVELDEEGLDEIYFTPPSHPIDDARINI